MIDSPSPSSTLISPLLLRSASLGKRGQAYEAVRDVERVLETEDSYEVNQTKRIVRSDLARLFTHLLLHFLLLFQAHSRATYAYLGLAFHHLILTKKLHKESGPTLPHLEHDFQETEKEIQSSRSRESKARLLGRISPELFIRILTFLDSPSLAMADGVCRSWKKQVSQCSHLFQTFQMKGRGSNINVGIGFFNKRCNNSIHTIRIEVKTRYCHSTTHQCKGSPENLKLAIAPSSKTLKILSVAHLKDINGTVLEIAEQCQSLSVFSCTELSVGKLYVQPPQNAAPLGINSSWTAKLELLEWNCASNLLCDDGLLRILKSAREVTIGSQIANSSFVVKLLSSLSNLETCIIPYMESDEVSWIPKLKLPNLKLLKLHHAPILRASGTSTLFFKSLDAPKLESLAIRRLSSHSDLGSLEEGSRPRRLRVLELPSVTEAGAAQFIDSLRGWKNLKELELFLTGAPPSSFWNSIVGYLAPVTAGYGEELPLPGLEKVVLGQSFTEPSHPPVSSEALMSLAASRIAASRGAAKEAPFGIVVNIPVTDDEHSLDWLKQNLGEFQMKWKYQESSPTTEPLSTNTEEVQATIEVPSIEAPEEEE